MKKKIKDLTKEETKRICDCHDWCHLCPLNDTFKCPNVDLSGEDEIEVPE